MHELLSSSVLPIVDSFVAVTSMGDDRFLVARVLSGCIQAAYFYYQERTATGLFSFVEFRGVLLIVREIASVVASKDFVIS